jgi:hypothetical protein
MVFIYPEYIVTSSLLVLSRRLHQFVSTSKTAYTASIHIAYRPRPMTGRVGESQDVPGQIPLLLVIKKSTKYYI